MPASSRARWDARLWGTAIDVITRHRIALGVSLVAAGVLLRAMLVWHSPVPYGYVWDFYHGGVRVLDRLGRLPQPPDCWQCSHPPAFYVIGWPFYALGRALIPRPDDEMGLRWLGGVAILSAAATLIYGDKLLRFYGARGASRVLGVAVLLAVPCLFISTYAPEGDILLAALLSAFLYYLARYAAVPALATTPDVVRLGVLLGLAAATKYSGLVGVVAAAIVWGMLLLAPERTAKPAARRRLFRHGLVVAALAVGIGGWKYGDNLRRYGTAFYEVGSAGEGFAMDAETRLDTHYEFTTLRLDDLRRVIAPASPSGDLTTLPVYRSVLTTLHAQLWSDMGMFSIPSRHGDSSDPYPSKWIPVRLSMAVIELGLVADALAIVGFVVTLRRRSVRPVAVFCVVSIATYVWWFLPQTDWALKTKYLLFLLPAFVFYVVAGLAWIGRRVPIAGLVAGSLLVALVAVAHVYQYAFAR